MTEHKYQIKKVTKRNGEVEYIPLCDGRLLYMFGCTIEISDGCHVGRKFTTEKEAKDLIVGHKIQTINSAKWLKSQEIVDEQITDYEG